MRRKALALCILLFLTACRASPGPEEGVKLYFASTRDTMLPTMIVMDSAILSPKSNAFLL